MLFSYQKGCPLWVCGLNLLQFCDTVLNRPLTPNTHFSLFPFAFFWQYPWLDVRNRNMKAKKKKCYQGIIVETKHSKKQFFQKRKSLRVRKVIWELWVQCMQGSVVEEIEENMWSGSPPVPFWAFAAMAHCVCGCTCNIFGALSQSQGPTKDFVTWKVSHKYSNWQGEALILFCNIMGFLFS